jgi:hypothetical protein
MGSENHRRRVFPVRGGSPNDAFPSKYIKTRLPRTRGFTVASMSVVNALMVSSPHAGVYRTSRRPCAKPDEVFIARVKRANGLVEKIAETCKRYKVQRLLIEDKTRGRDVAAELRRLYTRDDWGAQLTNQRKDKVSRTQCMFGYPSPSNDDNQSACQLYLHMQYTDAVVDAFSLVYSIRFLSEFRLMTVSNLTVRQRDRLTTCQI